uniref:Butyrophilin subfamily 1 member A1 n=1 Tax=Tetraodon nigroviridis TaxID=99883 RepID=H3C4X3_TETNG
GDTVTLPCWLSPEQSAEALDVQWHYDNKVDLLRYKDRIVSTPASHTGRVSFASRDAASGGLRVGDVSLELVNVTLRDSGEYTCYVSSNQNYDSAGVALAVTETGGPLRLSALWTDGDVVNVSCGSEGWHPEPYLSWSDPNGALTPGGVRYDRQSTGLSSVRSWLLVRSPSEIVCAVGLRGEEEKKAKLHLNPAPAAAGLAALAALLAVAVAALGIAFCKTRGRNIRLKREIPDTEEGRNIQLKREIPDTEEVFISLLSTVSISIPKSREPFLLMKDTPQGCVVRDRANSVPQGTKVSCLTAIAGTPGFSSGEHRWEVSVGNDAIGPKMSWWLGVTSVRDIPENELSPTASKGYWFLASSPENPDFFQLSTEPAAWIPVTSRPQTVGMYLNYERGEVTFYDVQNSSVIGRLQADFEGEAFPFF